MATKIIKAKVKRELPLVVYFSTFGFSLTGYVVGRIALFDSPHYLHWISGLLGGAIGFAFGWLWYKRRGDI